jgi:hypothetical protein
MGLIRDVIHAGGTGGLNWHVHAHYARQRWQPTVDLLDVFLAQVRPQAEHLLLIGCIAGWMMPPSWLARFERIDAYDIDPLAATLFHWRHGRHLRQLGVQLTHHRQDALAALPALLQEHPHACVWFDNVLGQHRYRVRDEVRVEQDLAALKHTLRGRHWGSVHDVYSGPSDGRALAHDWRSWQHHQVPAHAVADNFAQTLLSHVGAKDVWQDHLTREVFAPDTPTTLIPWAFKPNYWHWLQAGWVAAY